MVTPLRLYAPSITLHVAPGSIDPARHQLLLRLQACRNVEGIWVSDRDRWLRVIAHGPMFRVVRPDARPEDCSEPCQP